MAPDLRYIKPHLTRRPKRSGIRATAPVRQSAISTQTHSALGRRVRSCARSSAVSDGTRRRTHAAEEARFGSAKRKLWSAVTPGVATALDKASLRRFSTGMHDDDADAGPSAEDPLLPAGPESPLRTEMVRARTRALYDEIEHRREVRRCRLIEIATDSIHSSGLDLAAVNDRLLSDILQGGSSEHDPDLQELWANLLANALTDATPVPRAFPELMRQLEPVEARLLRQLAVQEAKHLVGSWVEFHELADVRGDVEWRHLDNLERLALLRFETSYPQNVELASRPPRGTMQIQLLLTPLGTAFLEACTGPAATGTAD